MDLSDQISTITYGNGVLDFDVDKVIIRTEADTLYQGSFRIQVHTPAQVHGYICASDIRLQISHDMFDGFRFYMIRPECVSRIPYPVKFMSSPM